MVQRDFSAAQGQGEDPGHRQRNEMVSCPNPVGTDHRSVGEESWVPVPVGDGFQG